MAILSELGVTGLTHFIQMFYFHTPFGFLTFSRGIEIERWPKIGKKSNFPQCNGRLT